VPTLARGLQKVVLITVRGGLLLSAIALSTLVAARAAASPSHRLVSPGSYLVADQSGHLLVLDQRGKFVSRIPRFTSPVQGLEIAPDRRHAYVSVYRNERAPRLYEVALRSGRRSHIANGIGPSLSPDQKRLAYVTVERRDEISYRTALAIRLLSTGRTRLVPLPAGTPLGTPPELVINWSPDGRRLAVFDGTVIRLVEVATATTVDSQPPLPGKTGLAPVFLNRHAVVVLANCCIGRQRLVAVDLRSGARTPFAELRAPMESVRRQTGGSLLIVTALQRLVRVSPGHKRVIATGVVAAASKLELPKRPSRSAMRKRARR
jgi:hypothetical protein